MRSEARCVRCQSMGVNEDSIRNQALGKQDVRKPCSLNAE